MENNERNNIYAVAFVGGILCIFSFFDFDILSFFNFNLILGLILLLFILPHIICGIIMIYSAIRIKLGQKTWNEQKVKLLISSWLAIGVSLGASIFMLIFVGYFMLFNRFGLIGGFLTLLGYYYHKHLTKSEKLSDPPLTPEKGNSDSIPL